MSKNAIYVWDFTAPVTAVTFDGLKKELQDKCKKWCFQQERGENTGYDHFQGRVSFTKKTRKPTSIINFPNFHWSPTTCDEADNQIYVTKEDTRTAGPWKDTDTEVYIPRQYRDIELRPFQQEIIDSAKNFDFRKIDLIYCSKGGSGKSTVASICELLYEGFDCPPLNDSKELIQAVCCYLVDRKIRQPKIMFFDMPRAMKKDQLNGMYTAIEQIKKGKVYDMRYHYKDWWFDSPRIWVFTNTEPDISLLSGDRWRLWTVDSEYQLVQYHPLDLK